MPPAPIVPPQASVPVPVAIPAAAPVAVPPQGLLARTQRFVEDNQKIILIGAAVAVGAGAGYYLYNRSSDGPGGSSSSARDSAGASGSSKKSKKSKKKKNSQFLKGEGNQGPLLEEIKPKENKATTDGKDGKAAVDEKKDESPLAGA